MLCGQNTLDLQGSFKNMKKYHHMIYLGVHFI